MNTKRDFITIFTVLVTAFLSFEGAFGVILSEIEQTELSSYYTSEEVSVTPAAPDYSLPLDPSAVANFSYVCSELSLSQEAQDLLRANGFVVVRPLPGSELDKLTDITSSYGYMTNRAEIPNFITSDTLLHLYHVLYDDILKNIEEREFFDMVDTMTQALLQESIDQYNLFSGDLKEAAKRNTAFFAVAMKILDPASTVPAFVSSEVDGELAKIEAHAGFWPSDIFIYREDYSQL